MAKSYYLNQNKESGIWYVRYIDEVTGTRTTAKSTGQTARRAAEKITVEWLASGFVPMRHNAKTDGYHSK